MLKIIVAWKHHEVLSQKMFYNDFFFFYPYSLPPLLLAVLTQEAMLIYVCVYK